LVVEGLSRLSKEANETSSFKGENFGGDCYVTHLFFINDIIIFCEGSRIASEKLKDMI
jgi:hypothetical protein